MVEIMAKGQSYELSSNAFEKRKNCPYCHDCSSDVIGQVYTPAFFEYPVGKIKINNQLSNDIYLLKCQNCGLLYKNLIVSREALSQVYKSSDGCCNYRSSSDKDDLYWYQCKFLVYNRRLYVCFRIEAVYDRRYPRRPLTTS